MQARATKLLDSDEVTYVIMSGFYACADRLQAGTMLQRAPFRSPRQLKLFSYLLLILCMV